MEELFPGTFKSRDEFEKTYEPVLNKLSLQELYWLNKLLVQRINIINGFQRHIAISKFRLGERVTWKDDTGMEQFGIVISRNVKTLTVQTDSGFKGRIHPSLLSIIDNK